MLKRLFSFKGRAGLKEYWVIQVILLSSLVVFIQLFGSSSSDPDIYNIIYTRMAFFIVFFIIFGIVSWAVFIRRLHDINLSGWFAFPIILIIAVEPTKILALLILIIFGALPSTTKKTKWDNDTEVEIDTNNTDV